VRPQLGGGHRRHRLILVLPRPPLTYSNKASVSREADTEGFACPILCPERWTQCALPFPCPLMPLPRPALPRAPGLPSLAFLGVVRLSLQAHHRGLPVARWEDSSL
jgi:hypothetical protein